MLDALRLRKHISPSLVGLEESFASCALGAELANSLCLYDNPFAPWRQPVREQYLPPMFQTGSPHGGVGRAAFTASREARKKRCLGMPSRTSILSILPSLS